MVRVTEDQLWIRLGQSHVITSFDRPSCGDWDETRGVHNTMRRVYTSDASGRSRRSVYYLETKWLICSIERTWWYAVTRPPYSHLLCVMSAMWSRSDRCLVVVTVVDRLENFLSVFLHFFRDKEVRTRLLMFMSFFMMSKIMTNQSILNTCW